MSTQSTTTPPKEQQKKKISFSSLSIRCLQLPHSTHLFYEQWEILSKLRHPNLCPCLSFISAPQHNIYYLTALQARTTMADEIVFLSGKAKRAVDGRVYSVCAQLFNALHVLHMHGIYLGRQFSDKNIYLDRIGNPMIGDYAFFHFCHMIGRLNGDDNAYTCAALDLALVAKIVLRYICVPKELKFKPNGNKGQVPDFQQHHISRLKTLEPSLLELLLSCVKFEITDSSQVFHYFDFFDTISPVKPATLVVKYVRTPTLKCLEIEATMNPPNLRQAKDENLAALKQFVLHKGFCEYAENFFVIEPGISYVPSITDLTVKGLRFPTPHNRQVLIPESLLPQVENAPVEADATVASKKHSTLATLRGLSKKFTHSKSDFVRQLFPQNHESTVAHQKSRVQLFRPLLLNCPISRYEILRHAKESIPPTLRGEIWSALLDVPVFSKMIKEWRRLKEGIKHIDRDIVLNRQIEVDVVRCHQYHYIMKTKAAKDVISAILLTWVHVYQTESYKSELLKGGAYWQGIDSIAAVFAVLNCVFDVGSVDNEPNIARALFSLDRFVNKFLSGYFVQVGHEGRMQSDLVVLSKLITWIDVEIGSHLELVGFGPELYAIPWLLTCFAHVLPMEKIYLLWDVVIVNDPSIILYIAVAIIRQLKSELLHCDFNSAMEHFQNLQGIDIRKAVTEAKSMAERTPTSFIQLPYVTTSAAHIARKEEKITLDEYRSYLTPRISASEFEKIYARVSIVLDIRPLSQFKKAHLRVATSIFHFTRETRDNGTDDEDVLHEDTLINRLKYKQGLPIILIDDTDDYSAFCKRVEKILILEKIPYVCAVFGGMRAIRHQTNLEILFE